MLKRSVVFALVTLGLAGCCFGGATTPGAPTPPGTPPPVGTAPPPVVGGGTVSIGPGFLPDPQTASGTAGGPVAANTMSPECRGYIAAAPNHILNATGQFMNLRIVVGSSADTTLVVQRADGTFACNDDSDGLNPAVDLANVQPGAYNVFVGTYAPNASASYQLGLTTNPSITPSTMMMPPTPPPPLGGGGAPGGVLRSGTATVALVSGNLPGVSAGTTCTYTQSSVDAAQYGFDCRWQVVCGGVVVYGDGEGGYNPCNDPSWPPGTLVSDINTSSSDRDPSLVINAGGMMVRDDAQGARGEYQITATMAPMPMPPG